MTAADNEAALIVDNVTKIYRNGNTANTGISFSITRGEVFGLLGPNGAGKSTLIRQIAGLSTPTSGTIKILGEPVHGSAPVHSVGYMPQSSFALNSLTVQEALYFTCHLSGASRRDSLGLVDQVVDELSLATLRRRHAAQLSGGQRRLLQLAVALVAQKPVVLLDEPTNELDPLIRRQVWRLLRQTALQRGTTILFITHNALEAERVVDRVGIVVGSKLVATETPAKLVASFPAPLRIEVRPEASVVLPGFQRVEGRDDTWERFVESSQIPAVLDRLDLAHHRGMSILPVNLEDVYVRHVAEKVETGVEG